MSGATLNEELSKLAEPYKKVSASIEAASSLSAQLNKQLITLGNSSKGPLDNIAASFQSITNEANQAAKEGLLAMEAFTKGLDQKVLKHLQDKYDSGSTEDTTSTAELLSIANTEMQKFANAAANAAASSKVHTNKMKELKNITALSASAAKEYYNEQRLSNIELVKGLKAKKATLKIGSADNQKQVLAIDKKIAALNSTQLLEAKETLDIEKAKINKKRMLLSLSQKIASTTASNLTSEMASYKQSILNTKGRISKTLTSEENISFLKEFETKKIENAKEVAKIARTNLELEVGLMRAKFQYLEQQAILLKHPLEPSFIKKYTDMLDKYQKAKTTSINNTETTSTTKASWDLKSAEAANSRLVERQKLTIITSDAETKITLENRAQEDLLLKISQKSGLIAESYNEQFSVSKLISEQKLVQYKIAKKLLELEQLKEGSPDKKTKLVNEIGILQAEYNSYFGKIQKQKRDISDTGKLMNELNESFESGMISAFDNIITGTESVKDAFGNMAISILKSLSQVISKMIAVSIMQKVMGMVGSTVGGSAVSAGAVTGTTTMDIGVAHARYGGVIENGKHLPGFATGGVASGSTAGYPVTLHGKEAVVPLPNGNDIPVELKGSSDINNVTVNVSMDGSGNTSQESSESQGRKMAQLGNLVSQAVQEELMRQKRPGGILSPYGAA